MSIANLLFTLGSGGKVEATESKQPARTELLQATVLPKAVQVQQTTKLVPYGMLRTPTRHFFSDGDGLWGEHNPHFGKQKMGDSRW
mmetsp:Transcript_42633/g.114131  ORF Transcript_42633/g.114131 Transcript_42633/m.114131 type:complete len:86 (-) Transcript_42633:79-336(-)